MTKHIGDLRIYSKGDAAKYASIEEVTGSLYISADAQLPVLTSVGGSLYISADAQLPVLTSVGDSLYIGADAQLPVLTSVGGYLYISADAQLPVLTSVGGSLNIRADAQLPVLTSVGGMTLTMPPIVVTGLDWPVSILDTTMRIGCQEHSLADWAAFDDRRIAEMDGRKALRFWSQHKADLLGRAEAAGRVIAVAVEV